MALTRTSRLSRTTIGSVVVVGALIAAPIAAQAVPHPQAPTPTTSAQVTVKLASLAKSSEQLAEQMNKAQIDITAAQKAAAAATSAAVAAQAHLQTAQRLLSISISSQYKSASFSRTAALLGSTSSEGYLQTVQSMSLLTQHQSEVATMAASAITAAALTSKRATAAVAAATATQAVLVSRRNALNAQTTKYKALLATLTAVEKAKYFSPVAAPAPAKIVAAFAAAIPAATSTTVTAKSKLAVSPATSASASKGAAAAIESARSELGKPYVWGAGGPASFDCSGLTASAWGAAGVSLPHNAAAQSSMGTAVAASALQPGDLVFFGSPAYHVGLYIGDGLMIHAPTSGDVVKIISLSSMMNDFSGARRVG